MVQEEIITTEELNDEKGTLINECVTNINKALTDAAKDGSRRSIVFYVQPLIKKDVVEKIKTSGYKVKSRFIGSTIVIYL